MQTSILIKSSGLYFVKWDPLTGDEKSQTKIKANLAKYLGNYAEFDENITFGEFLMVLNEFVDEVDYIFSYYLNGVEFNDFFQESLIEPASIPSIDRVELSWKIRIVSTTEINVIDFIPVLIGIKEIPDTNTDEIHDLDFVSIRDISQFNIFALTALDIPNPDTYKVVVEAERRWTLFEIISGVLAEISKYGSPADRLTLIEEVKTLTRLEFSSLLDYIADLEIEKSTSTQVNGDLDDYDDEDD